MTLRSLALTSVALSVAAQAFAASASAADRWYISLGNGFESTTNLSLSGVPDLNIGGTVYHTQGFQRDDAWRGIAAAGYQWNDSFRVEAEVGFSNPDISALVANGQNFSVSDTDVSQVTLFGNAIYDLPLNESFALSLGGGLGLGITELHIAGTHASSNGFAYQAIAGLTYRWSDAIGLSFDYRYVGLTNLSYFAYGSDTASHNLMLSLRWYPGQSNEHVAANSVAAHPPRAVTPTVAPAAVAMQPSGVKTYVVFFDINKSYLTDAAEAVVAESVKAARTHGIVKIQIAGLADANQNDYRMRLSLARAASVKDEMIRLGLDSTAIAVEGKGYAGQPTISAPEAKLSGTQKAVIDLGW
jgi:outer membrane protein OmpA-like peptidoglycan-associated protein